MKVVTEVPALDPVVPPPFVQEDTSQHQVGEVTVAARGAVLDDADRATVDREIAVYRLMFVLLGAAGAMVLALMPFIGWKLATPEIVLVAISMCHVTLVSQLSAWLAHTPDSGRILEGVRWSSSTLEATFPTLALLIAARIKGDLWAATSPIFAIYTLIIVCSAVRMRPRITFYVAVVGALQWLAVYHLILHRGLDTAALPTISVWAAWERAFWLLLTGAAMAVGIDKIRSATTIASRASAAQRRRIERQLERLVSPEIAKQAMTGAVELGRAERREVTVLFCDLRDFTALCERREPEQALEMLNAFYQRACFIVRAHGGHVNKFLGDGLLALFGAPQDLPQHARAAVSAGQQIAIAAAELRAAGGLWADFRVGVGIDTGDVVVGALGASDRMEYTAIGATVNRAARLQALSESTHRPIVLSDRCARALGDDASLVALGEASIKGVTRPIRIFTPIVHE